MKKATKTLETQYREVAETYGTAYIRGDHKVANRSYDKLATLLERLRETGDRGEEILRRLMKDPSDAVAMWAATHSLPIDEENALAALASIGQKEGIIGFSAKMVIKEWKIGRLVID